MHLHLASHLGMLDEPREGRDVGAKPKDGVWWTYPDPSVGRTFFSIYALAPNSI
jgi:hypothetical protein